MYMCIYIYMYMYILCCLWTGQFLFFPAAVLICCVKKEECNITSNKMTDQTNHTTVQTDGWLFNQPHHCLYRQTGGCLTNHTTACTDRQVVVIPTTPLPVQTDGWLFNQPHHSLYRQTDGWLFNQPHHCLYRQTGGGCSSCFFRCWWGSCLNRSHLHAVKGHDTQGSVKGPWYTGQCY